MSGTNGRKTARSAGLFPAAFEVTADDIVQLESLELAIEQLAQAIAAVNGTLMKPERSVKQREEEGEMAARSEEQLPGRCLVAKAEPVDHQWPTCSAAVLDDRAA